MRGFLLGGALVIVMASNASAQFGGAVAIGERTQPNGTRQMVQLDVNGQVVGGGPTLQPGQNPAAPPPVIGPADSPFAITAARASANLLPTRKAVVTPRKTVKAKAATKRRHR